MRGCVQISSAITALLALMLFSATAALAEPPQRVVSVNLCTDQLALGLAAPGQLISVSRLSQDPASSVMVAAAQALPANGSGAEEVFLLSPDLVLAGTFTSPDTVRALRNLGVKVKVFAPARSLAEIPVLLAQMGKALGREAEADLQIKNFRAALAKLVDAPSVRPRAALYYANSYTTGTGTLAGSILKAAGFDNIATEYGLKAGGTLPLEQLILSQPDVIITGRDYPGQARAENNLTHPALRALDHTRIAPTLSDRDWICGTPQVLDAVRAMRKLRLSLEAE